MNITKYLRDWLDGCRDCRDGVPHTDKGEAYNRGYAFKYELDQIMEHQNERK